MRFGHLMIFAAGLLHAGSGVCAQETQRLTDNLTEKPCIVVSSEGSHVAWSETRDEAAPVNRTYRIKVYDVVTKQTLDVLQVPGIVSNQPMRFLLGDEREIRGPNYKESDRNYRIIGDITKLRLSGDGHYLATCVEEQFNSTERAPFFVIVNLRQNSFEVISVQVPDGMGAITGDWITSKMNQMYWDLNPAGTHLAYVLDAVNRRGSAVIAYDIQAKTSRRILGYERAGYVGGDLNIEGPDEQRILYGSKMTLGSDTLVIAGSNLQRQDGLWIVGLSQATAAWHTVSFAVPGISGRHVYYSSQKPAVWLNSDGTQRGVIEQKAGLFNQASVPFWSNMGSAYMTDQTHTSILKVGEGDPVPVAQKAEMGVPQAWRFRLKETSSADSYRLASHNGGTLAIPVSDPRNNRNVDLFLMTRHVPQAAGSVAEVQSDSTGFSSRVDAFEIGSLLKPGELPGKFMPDDVKAAAGGEPLRLPSLPAAANWDRQASATSLEETIPDDMLLTETAEQAHGQAEMMLMLGELNDKTLAPVIERLEKAVELAPENRAYRLDLARAYVAANTMLSVGAGIEEYSLLLQKNPADDEALAGMADAYLQLGNLEEAMEIVYLRTVMNPTDAAVRQSAALQMAVFALDSADTIGVLAWLRQLYAEYPRDSFIQGLIGLMWEMDGDSRRAEAIFENVIDGSPPDDPVRACIVRLKSALEERRVQ